MDDDLFSLDVTFVQIMKRNKVIRTDPNGLFSKFQTTRGTKHPAPHWWCSWASSVLFLVNPTILFCCHNTLIVDKMNQMNFKKWYSVNERSLQSMLDETGKAIKGLGMLWHQNKMFHDIMHQEMRCCFLPRKPKWVIKQVPQMLKPGYNLQQQGKGLETGVTRPVEGQKTRQCRGYCWGECILMSLTNCRFSYEWNPPWLWFSIQQIHLQVCRQVGVKMSIYYPEVTLPPLWWWTARKTVSASSCSHCTPCLKFQA